MITATLRRWYHALVPFGIRRAIRVNRFDPTRRARSRLWHRTDGCVATGPFRGLLFNSGSPEDAYPPVLLGSYESDVHEWLEREIARGWPAVVNIGSNSGYYSTGLARRLPGAVVHAFEMDDALREETRRSAVVNGASERVRVLGTADVASLAALPVERALVVCDCEGAERELLDTAAIPWLRQSAVLVELHDFAAPGTTEVLRSRFAPTHAIVEVQQRPRDARIWAARAGISERDAALLSVELRPWHDQLLPGRWMLLTPLPD